MKRIFALTALFLVLGCSTKATSVSVAETAKESLTALDKALTPECKTPEVMAELIVTRRLIDNTLATCESEKKLIQVESDKKTWAIAFLVLCVAFLLWLLVRKKF